MRRSDRRGPLARTALACSIMLAAWSAKAGEVVFGLAAPSAALGRDIPYSLYRPAEAPAPGERWPVLYLLHGLGDDERVWATLGRAAETLDGLLAARKLKPILVVMPMAQDSWYVDNPDPGSRGLFAQALTRDLVDHIDRVYPTAACRAGRALGGLSMGGYGALLYAMDNPRRYAAAFSFSGSLFRPMPDEEAARAGRPTHMFRAAFGQPFDARRFNRWNLFPRLPAYIAEKDRPAFYLTVGDNDFPRLKEGNIAFHRALAEAGVDAPFRIDPGQHNWTLWAAQLGPALTWLDRHLSPSC
ncbi:MAG TPA: alpha/beta hydrolase family protein [Beijerinckiaceae bacterium]|nr:alpha/beta hydrolase family protein [Beijerinckiaceae bacterium]